VAVVETPEEAPVEEPAAEEEAKNEEPHENEKGIDFSPDPNSDSH